MNTMQAEYKTDIARLAEDAAKREKHLADRIHGLAEDAAKRDAEAAKRETRMTVTFVGITIASVTLAVAILGILITRIS